MAEAAPKTEAPKAAAHSKADDLAQYTEDENGNLVFNGEVPDLDRIAEDRKRVSDELEKSDRYDSNGLADNVTGDASEKASDPFRSPDPAKRPFPPGPDDPSKL